LFYGKLLRSHSTLIAPRLLPSFVSLFGIPRRTESKLLSEDAQKILKILRKEWEMATRDLRLESGISERGRFDKAMVQLQKTFKVIPTDVLYEPTFTYIWSIPEARFQDQMKRTVTKDEALKEIAQAYLSGAGMCLRGELARVTGLSQPDAGLGNWALVDDGFAERLWPGIYRLAQMAPQTGARGAGHS
jgi:hypothetical protein